MTDKRMLIVAAELVKKIDENRGDMGQGEFIDYLIESHLGGASKNEKYVTQEQIESFKRDIKKIITEETKDRKYTTKEDFHSFQQDTRKLLKSFLDFFVGYGLELGKQSPKADFAELTSKLDELEKDMNSDAETGKATIKWK